MRTNIYILYKYLHLHAGPLNTLDVDNDPGQPWFLRQFFENQPAKIYLRR